MLLCLVGCVGFLGDFFILLQKQRTKIHLQLGFGKLPPTPELLKGCSFVFLPPKEFEEAKTCLLGFLG